MRFDKRAKRLLQIAFAAVVGLTAVGVAGSESALSRLYDKENEAVTVGHRGASGYAPENTLSSYRLAVGMKADYIEIDLQMTKDGELVVMHDPTVDRTTNGTGKVSDMTLFEIKALDAGSWFNAKHPMYAREEFRGEKVPSLRDVFESFGDQTRYMLETKAQAPARGMEEKLIKLAKEYRLTHRIVVQSFNKSSLKKIRSMDKDVMLFQLLRARAAMNLTNRKLAAIRAYANGIGAPFDSIGEKEADLAKRSGLLVYLYTLNYQPDMETAMKWGADGIHTDYPDRFKEVLAEHGGIG